VRKDLTAQGFLAKISSNRGLSRRFRGRMGDLYKIQGAADAEMNKQAIPDLSAGIDVQRGRYQSSVGYFTVRSFGLTTARSPATDREVRSALGLIDQALQSGQIPAVDEPLLLEAAAEMCAIRKFENESLAY